MLKIIFNHKILNKKELNFSVDNRAFLYGDGLFESVKIINSKPFNLEVHLKRLFSASTLLDLQISASKKDFRNKIELLIKENKIIKGSTSNNISGSFNKANLEANKKSPSPTFEILLANSAESINKTTNVDIANETANDIKNFLEK